ncbi:MAG: MetQ/NlpA family ABC transporter substrate-binding protein [Synergistaceae bacterium]|jgi:D-methionine transport system substrate-binding protein|nr:MetQ/NlpA family ABC transporter substrate-binding protein [Synergistaceae bacterium]
MKSSLGKIFLAVFALVCFLTGVTEAADGRAKVKVGIVGESDEEIWAPVVKKLANEGVDVELVNFSDYTLPNAALDAGEIDLNAFQHYNYLNNENKTHGYKLSAIGETYLSAMCVYSKKIKSVKELKKGDKIAIPNDAVNTGRALTVLQGAGVFKLKPVENKLYETTDIESNPLEIEIVPVDAAQVPSVLPDVAAGVINGNYALDFGLSPTKDSIFYDNLNFYKDKGYVNVIAVRTQDIDNALYKKVVKAYQSEDVEKVYKEFFEGSYLPAWK